MQVSLTQRVTGRRPFAAGTSPQMPSSLDPSGLDLPNGIARKTTMGSVLPPGIARRFPPQASAEPLRASPAD